MKCLTGPRRFLIVSSVFPPEPIVSSRTSAKITEALREKGHIVAVVTAFPSRPAGRLYAGYKRKLLECEREDPNLQLFRCFSFLSAQSSMLSRFLENISFGITSAAVVLTMRRPDVIYSNTWPIFATGILSLVAHLRHIPIVISVQDIYPESLISQGRISANGLIARLIYGIDSAISQNCQSVIAISDSFASFYKERRNVPAKNVYVVPNWMDAQVMNEDDGQATKFRSQLSIPENTFVTAYGGNIGMAAGVESVIKSMGFIEDAEHLCLLIAGEGSNLSACQQLASQQQSGHIVIHTPWPQHETAMVLKSANVLVLPTRGKQSLASVPSKLITYMLSARPIIALALPESDIAQIIVKSQCGWIVPPDRPDLLGAQIEHVMHLNSDELVQRGQNGREYALKHFTPEVCLPRVVDIIEKAAQSV